MEFKTNKGKRIEGLKIDGKDIFVVMNTSNLLKFSKITEQDINIDLLTEIIKTLCDDESAKAILHLSLEDFVTVGNILVEYIEKEKNKLESKPKFSAE